MITEKETCACLNYNAQFSHTLQTNSKSQKLALNASNTIILTSGMPAMKSCITTFILTSLKKDILLSPNSYRPKTNCFDCVV